MAKMSKTQRTAVLDFHNGVTNKAYTMLVRSVRTLDAMVANGWAVRVTEHTGNVTTAGLIEAGVDMDAVETEADKENNRREVDDRAGILARHAAEVRDLDHAEALDDDDARYVAEGRELLSWDRLPVEQAHDEALHHLPKNCPDPRRACGRCTSPAAARAARGDDSAYTRGRPWVAEIQKCPRCGLTADKHPTAAPPPVAEPTHTVKRGLRSA